MKKKNNELATVLIANFNNSKYLKKCLLSVINQSYKNIHKQITWANHLTTYS